MNRLSNEEIRLLLKKNKIPVWRLADELQCHENTVFRLLRHPLPDDKRNKIVRIIERLATEDADEQ